MEREGFLWLVAPADGLGGIAAVRSEIIVAAWSIVVRRAYAPNDE